MRIVAGSRRGLTLEAPEGQTTRPTSDRAREALFNILAGPKYLARLRDRPVADFFAGSGAVGLEAVSRGAAACTFLETDPAALQVLRRNISRLKDAAATCRVLARDASRPPKANEACGLLFFDPPYDADVAVAALLAAMDAGWLAEDGLAVIQVHPKRDVDAPDGFEIADDRKYGATRFLFLERAQ
ncbi:16S rRNA (guanine(966)-N(2))-methyltransferase RsmD [Pacificispira sp.]|uniref:16S rRNA (guanine(966)-N(2))-methyltransferase RsmD n=1 Tax=Pacificispira sp. TaxID=2888761 RepID=UPI003B525D02